jgi:hypothetical protein
MIVYFHEQSSCYHRQCLLHHIYVSQINHDNIHQGPEIIFGDKDIHSLLDVAKEKVGELPLNMCSILQNNSCNSILKYIVGYDVHSHKGTKTNGYLNHQWYDQTNNVKDGQLEDVASQNKYIVL